MRLREGGRGKWRLARRVNMKQELLPERQAAGQRAQEKIVVRRPGVREKVHVCRVQHGIREPVSALRLSLLPENRRIRQPYQESAFAGPFNDVAKMERGGILRGI